MDATEVQQQEARRRGESPFQAGACQSRHASLQGCLKRDLVYQLTCRVYIFGDSTAVDAFLGPRPSVRH